MYSETPPEKLTASGLRLLRSGASRSKAVVSAPRAGLLTISNKWSAMRSTIVLKRFASGFPPISRGSPTSAANRRPASSMRATRPSASKETMRAPTSTAVSSATSPASHTAIFVVPPPRSTFITRADSRTERAQAPEPKAARVASSASPALTETNFPTWEANSSPIARALLRRTATPVRIRAPVSIALGSTAASWYCLSMKRPSSAASMVASPEYGVRRTSDS